MTNAEAELVHITLMESAGLYNQNIAPNQPPSPRPAAVPQEQTFQGRFWGMPHGIFELVRGIADASGIRLQYTAIGEEGLFFKTHYAQFQATGTPDAIARFKRSFESIRPA